MNNLKLLREELERYGIAIPLNFKSSNRFIRWGKNNRYWAREVGEGYVFGDFASGIKSYIFPDSRKANLAEKRRIKRINGKIMDDQRKTWDKTAKKAYELWYKLPSAKNDHPYLMKKHVGVSPNVKIHNSQLVIPLVNISGELSTLQFIDSSGNKRFFPGGQKKGCFYSLGELSSAETIYICEGHATGMSLNKIVSPVVICFDAGNLKPVAINIRRKYPNTLIVICADNDCGNGANTGLQKAYEAAASINNASVIYPEANDFNDMDRIFGIENLRLKIKKSQVAATTDSNIPLNKIDGGNTL